MKWGIKMRVFVCNACHRVFEAESSPNACPSCHLDCVLGSTDTGRRVAFPAVRAATDVEIQAYEDVGKVIQEERTFLEWVDNLSAYDLSDDEYHVALMLLHSFKTTPELYTRHFISDLLPVKRNGIEQRAVQAMARNL